MLPVLDEQRGFFDHFQKYVGSTLHPGCNRSWQNRLLLGAHFFSFGKGPTTGSLGDENDHHGYQPLNLG